VIHKPIDQIQESDLQNLVIQGMAEGRQLEYKEKLPRKENNEEIKEFLKDVSAMANTLGGDLLYGIREGQDSNGNTVAVEVVGVSGEDADDVKLRLEDSIRNCIKPRLIGIGIKEIVLANANTAFIVRVPRSWNSPHVVDRKGHWRFYYRNSAGAHPMDVTELRHAVISADTLAQRLEEFRLERLAKIAADHILDKSAKIVLHLQPFSSVLLDSQVDFRIARRNIEGIKLIAPDSFSTTRPNFDGMLGYLQGKEKMGWLQIFRNGVVEAVDTDILELVDPDKPHIPIKYFEGQLLGATTRYLTLLKALGVVPPVLLSLSLLGVKRYTIGISREDYGSEFLGLAQLQSRAEQYPIDHDDLLMPGRLIEDFGANIEELLQPLFDMIWNAGGLPGSLFYNAEGRWTGRIQRR
jgi:hypothetical protein